MQPPGFTLTFLYYFSITNVIVIGLLSGRFGVSYLDRSIYPIGICAGLMAGILGASFNRNVTVSAKVKKKGVWLKSLNKALAEMGFEPQKELGEYSVYQKSGLATLFSGRVFLKIEGKTATVIGRAAVVKTLQEGDLGSASQECNE